MDSVPNIVLYDQPDSSLIGANSSSAFILQTTVVESNNFVGGIPNAEEYTDGYGCGYKHVYQDYIFTATNNNEISIAALYSVSSNGVYYMDTPKFSPVLVVSEFPPGSSITGAIQGPSPYYDHPFLEMCGYYSGWQLRSNSCWQYLVFKMRLSSQSLIVQFEDYNPPAR